MSVVGTTFGWALVGAKLLLLSWIGNMLSLHSAWDWAWEVPTTCQNPVHRAGDSGIKVLIYAPAKTGTKSMTKALLRLGFNHTYHSEDFLLNVWSGIADNFWGSRASGDARNGTGQRFLASVFPPANKGTPWMPTDSDVQVLRGLTDQELADALSACRVDAMAFDGIEELFWRVQAVSPGAKVVSLPWRTWPQYKRSHTTFDWQLTAALWVYSFLWGSLQLLPWTAVLCPTLDAVDGGSLSKLLATGGPPYTSGEESLAVRLFRLNAVHRRWMTHVKGGLEWTFANESAYLDFFEEGRRRIPAGNLLEWDMRRNSMPDLCRFLDMDASSHRACTEAGPLPKGVNVLFVERETPLLTALTVPILVGFHWANYRIVGFLLSLPVRLTGLVISSIGSPGARLKRE